jgi:hypothetical protein
MRLPKSLFAALTFLISFSAQAASPRILDLSTNRAPLGGEITIFGDDFIPSAAIVLVGGVPAPVISGNVSYLKVNVPGGALPGPIFVIEDAAVARSSTIFTPLPLVPGTLTNSFAERELSRKEGFLPLAAVADFDGDGKSDFVVARLNTLEIFHNQSTEGLLGSNSFSSTSLPIAGLPQCLVTGDLNGDGKPDLIYTQGDTLVARQNQISGPGISPDGFMFPVVLPARNVFRPVHVGDLDQDGRADIVAASPSVGIVVFWNRFTGDTFKKTDFTNTFLIKSNSGLATRQVMDFDIADLNQDGHPDIAAVIGTNLVVFALEDERGDLRTNFIRSFILGPARAGLIDSGPDCFAISDLNGDGNPDIIVSESRNVVAYLNHSRPDHFDATSFERVVLVDSGFYSFLLVDVDGDGGPELLAENRMLFKVVSADGQIISNSARDRILLPTELKTFTIADINGDNRPEIFGIRVTGAPYLELFQNLGVPSPPRLALRQAGVRRTISIMGTPVSTFHLQRSVDLIQWQTTTELRVSSTGEMNYVDTTSGPKGFFRLVQ